jgi:hypothetical protein
MAVALLLTSLLCLAGKAIAQDKYTGNGHIGVFHGCFTVISLPPNSCGSPQECEAFCANYGGYWVWTSTYVSLVELNFSSAC